MSEMSDYFDAKASNWDNAQGNRALPTSLLDLLGDWAQDATVLDVGCGTGVMESCLLDAGAACISATDVSPEMIAQAKKKYAAFSQVHYFCQDVLDFKAQEQSFDLVLMYNVYPHLMDKPALVAKVAKLLKPGGHFLVAHGKSRAEINACHSSVPHTITSHLASPQEEGKVWEESTYFSLDVLEDGDSYYLLGGTRR